MRISIGCLIRCLGMRVRVRRMEVLYEAVGLERVFEWKGG